MEIEFLKLDFHSGGVFVNKLLTQFTKMPLKWKSSLKDLISNGIFGANPRVQNYLRPMPLQKIS